MSNNVRTTPMEGFIQALYGVVIGVGSLDVFAGSKPGDPISAFKVFFVFSTILIGAHDWFSYHNSTHRRKKTHFSAYFPQIGALFFLGLMVKASSQTDLVKWYLWGLGYTVFNIAGMFNLIATAKEFFIQVLKYIIHILICIVAMEVLLDYDLSANNTNPDILKIQWFVFGATMGVVIILWLISHEQKTSKS